ncbi:DNA ligase 1 isoform X2 [Benincasa hispida]|uniref:DNA ligase 1 isoform X2 n=1 Tax=Benincasa hispida TaxID=102211 RepID=UPI00190253C0|nr:DNA ligase 1 isoform X2 [Benincasa hispida]
MGNMKTPTTKARVRKRVSDTDLTSSDQRKRTNDDLDLDLDLSDDLKGIVSALNQIKERAHKDDQKKNEETISSVATEMRTMIEQVKSKLEKDRQNFAKALSKSSKEDETAKFRALYEKFTKEKATHLQAIKDTISKFEEEKERLFVKYEQLRKRERSLISEQEKACAEKIAQLEESLKRKKQDDKTFSLLRKTLGSFLETGSDEDFPADD